MGAAKKFCTLQVGWSRPRQALTGPVTVAVAVIGGGHVKLFILLLYIPFLFFFVFLFIGDYYIYGYIDVWVGVFYPGVIFFSLWTAGSELGILFSWCP